MGRCTAVDVVLAADAWIQESGHFPVDTEPGDGVHIVFPLLMGQNRGRCSTPA
ncbi:MAG TPA: hypothetical protein VJ870_20775 [Amycolatopsis sp.]|nr:hypothetical protein [Amycolatopsis sp.]